MTIIRIIRIIIIVEMTVMIHKCAGDPDEDWGFVVVLVVWISVEMMMKELAVGKGSVEEVVVVVVIVVKVVAVTGVGVVCCCWWCCC